MIVCNTRVMSLFDEMRDLPSALRDVLREDEGVILRMQIMWKIHREVPF